MALHVCKDMQCKSKKAMAWHGVVLVCSVGMCESEIKLMLRRI